MKEEEIQDGSDFAGSFDIGDISHLMPILHPLVGGVRGNIHTRDFKPDDMELAVMIPAKCMAMTVIDLLSDDAETAGRIVKNFKPQLTKKSYLDLMDKVSKVVTV